MERGEGREGGREGEMERGEGREGERERKSEPERARGSEPASMQHVHFCGVYTEHAAIVAWMIDLIWSARPSAVRGACHRKSGD